VNLPRRKTMDQNIMTRIGLMQGDITALEVDAIVNAANKTLLGGGGVDGAIHRAAGPLLLRACRELGGCEVGDAKITRGFNLKAQYVIHTVGPVYSGKPIDARLLSGCYLNSLKIAEKYHIRSIAFPAISCGVYGYPIQEACGIAVDTVIDFLRNSKTVDKIIFVLFSVSDYSVYGSYLNAINR
jgi:O-acetyl-ADP-ribose deacetylase